MINSDVYVPVSPVGEMRSDKFLMCDNNTCIHDLNFDDKFPKEFEIDFILIKQSKDNYFLQLFNNVLIDS